MFDIYCMGCGYKHDETFEINRSVGYDCFLALNIRSRCKIMVDGEIREYEPNTFVLFNKKTPQYYAAAGEKYVDDFIQFDTDEDFMRGRTFQMDYPVYIGDNFDLSAYFKIIRNAFYRCRNNDAVIYHLFNAMMIEISDCAEKGGGQVPHFGELLRLRRRIYEEPAKEWHVEQVASEMGLCVPYFQEIYKKAFGDSCMSDVISSRIIKARDILISSDYTIEEVSRQCGYHNVVHFSRQFKQHMGMSPSEWRRLRPVKAK